MTKEKKELNPEQFNEFLVEVATRVEPVTLGDIFSGKAFKDIRQDMKEDNPLIKSYKNIGSGFINKILRDETDYKFTDEDKKLLIEVGAFGDPDPKSGFKLNYKDPKIANLVEENAKKLAEAKPNMSNAEYESYRANLRKDLVDDVLKAAVTSRVFAGTAPQLDIAERDKTKPFSDFITKELQMQSGLGFNPNVPDYAGGVVGYEYNPARNQERFRVIPERKLEGYTQPERRIDRLKDFFPDKESGFLRGPEGIFYNPQTEQFLRQKEVYGPPPTLQGYQYDPRLRGILGEAINPDYASQFNEGGKTMNIKDQVNNIASKGRFGDSMLMHVNPMEVAGLSQVMPLTINPDTGQPEAFLPFLAPILGSLAGSALLPTIIPSLAGKTLLASAIGSGLAQTAATGDLKKGLLAGLTGYGLGRALQGAGAAAQGAKAGTAAEGAITSRATQAATDAALMDPNLVNTALQGPAIEGAAGIGLNTAGQDFVNTFTTDALAQGQPVIAQATQTGFGTAGAPGFVEGSRQYMANNPALSQAISDAGGFSLEGGKNLFTGLTKPGAFIPIATGMGGTGVLESQELFEEMLARNAREAEEQREAMFRDNPENIPIATGGVTNFQEGGNSEIDVTKLPNYDPAMAARTKRAGSFDNYKNSLIQGEIDNINRVTANLGIDTSGIFSQNRDGGLYSDPYDRATAGNFNPVQRQALDIPTNYMAGFMPEMGYFSGLNPSFSQITESGDTVSVDPLEQYNRDVIAPQVRRPFDPTQTQGYQSFYGDLAQNIIPTQVDPYAPVDFTPPPMPAPAMPAPIAPIMPTPIRPAPIQPIPIDDERIVNIPEIPNMPDMPIGIPTPKAQPIVGLPNIDIGSEFVRNFDAIQGSEPLEKKEGRKLKPIPEDNKGLPKLPEDVRNKMGFLQAGRKTELLQDPLTARLVAHLRGEITDDKIVGQFVEKYGNDTYLQIRETILQDIVPQAETQGQINRGNDAGGMADNIYGKIGATQGVAVSQDEYVIPADAMSMLGDGSSDAGAKKLDAMLDRIRLEKTGTTKQAKEINDSKVLPA